MRIWAKLMTDGRIKKQFVYENPEKLTYSHFFEYLTEICQTLDIPTPVLTKTHISLAELRSFLRISAECAVRLDISSISPSS